MTEQPPPSSVQATAELSFEVERLVREYFSAPERTLHLNDGDVVLTEGEANDRLYYVAEGQFIGHSKGNEDSPQDFLIVVPGEFFGIRSFSIPRNRSAMTVRADGPGTVHFASLEDIRNKRALSPEQVLLPIFGQAMLYRQKVAYRLREQEEEQQRRLLETQELSQLGQFSAGVAHELNNAISVISRGADWLARAMERLVREHSSDDEFAVFSRGLHYGRTISSSEARKTAKMLREAYGISRAAAQVIGQIGLSHELLARLVDSVSEDPARLRDLWELGATFRDLTVAAQQTASVVESMKHLGGKHARSTGPVSVHESIQDALSIMRGHANAAEIRLDFCDSDLQVRINKGELIQVWVNLIDNAFDAMWHSERRDQKERAELLISTKVQDDQLIAEVRDNGPGIPENLLKTIFQPSFSTKKSGLSFGLGIGLTIVRRILTSAGGDIVASNWERGACMTITMPLALPHLVSETEKPERSAKEKDHA